MVPIRKNLLIYLLLFIVSTSYGQSLKNLKVADKQAVLNSSREYREIEKYLSATWYTINQVGQLFVTDFQRDHQRVSRGCFGPLPSEEQNKIVQKKFKQMKQVLFNFDSYRIDTFNLIKQEIESLIFEKIIENFNRTKPTENIVIVDKSSLVYFAEEVDFTKTLQQFISPENPPEDIRKNIFFEICESIFKKYNMEKILSLKYRSPY